EWYAIAKIAGIKLAQAYRQQYGFRAISLMPTNLYGPGDQFDLNKSHVLPALMRKAHEARLTHAREMVVWGSGNPRREFLHVDDLADAAVFLMLHYEDPEIVNVGVGSDVTIRELAQLICKVTGFEGRLVFDTSKPDGMAQKLLDVSKLANLGWRARIGLEEGIAATYRWFLAGEQGEVRLAAS
ncbi:MAG TPA: NAD-dependent epimerase/dehydratase family protein, partial [Bryobacteraceae bacterium]|nr:NAD-dependent epimerase/dehydratase family protein [Bryobacteraceae bacterium]